MSRSALEGSVEMEARRLVERLGGRWAGDGGMCLCPAHEDRTASLSVRPGRSRLLLHCFAGCSASDVLQAILSKGLMERAAPPGELHARAPRELCGNGAALRIWSEARPIGGTPAEAYLERRGIRTLPQCLRYHPETPLGRGALAEFRPALVAAVRDDCGVVAIHRTFLGPDGTLAGIEGPRRGLGPFRRGAVRLAGAGPVLGLAEGIETALSASLLFEVPCWATLGAERFGRVSLPAEVRTLLLFVDHDPGGHRAEALARGAFGHLPRIEARYPPVPGEDWNDVLRRSSRTTSRGATGPAPAPSPAGSRRRFSASAPCRTPWTRRP